MMNSHSRDWRIWWEAARPRTLPAAVAPVLVACALAQHDGVFHAAPALACFAFALLVQIGTNFANDYFDFRKGADTPQRVGPRRAVAAGLVAPESMLNATILVFAAAFAVGLTLLPFGGWLLLLVGVLSIACGVLYTGGPYPLAYHGWGDAFVFLFFGLVAVTITFYVQAGHINGDAWWIGAAVGALATNILVVNNYRDVATDARAGKRTLVVRWGRGYARAQFAAAHLAAAIIPLLLAARGTLSILAAGLITLFAAGVAVLQLGRLVPTASAPQLIALLGGTGRYLAIYALALSVALLR